MCFTSFLSGHLTDSECNQRHTSKKSSLADRKRNNNRSRKKGDETQSSGYHSEGKNDWILLFVFIKVGTGLVFGLYQFRNLMKTVY